MGFTIFIKACQCLETIIKYCLLGAPNTIVKRVIKKVMDLELQFLKKELVINNPWDYPPRRHKIDK